MNRRTDTVGHWYYVLCLPTLPYVVGDKNNILTEGIGPDCYEGKKIVSFPILWRDTLGNKKAKTTREPS